DLRDRRRPASQAEGRRHDGDRGEARRRVDDLQIRRRRGVALLASSRVCLLVCAIAAAGPPAAAQTLVGATVGASTQGEGASDLPYLGPPFGGTTAAVLVSVDRAPARNIALGG